MGRSPCCEKVGLKKGPWTPEEDQKLMAYIEAHGHGSWRALPAKAGLQRCGKSCRLRWTNYLRPDIKRGKFSIQEEQTIIQLHALLGNRWSAIATHLPKRTDNEIKNYWNTHLKKRLTKMGIDPVTHKPKTDTFGATNSKDAANLSHMAQWESARLQAEARLVRESKLAANQLSATFAANKAAVPPPLPCLDVLRAWQSAWFSRPTSSSPSAAGKDHPLAAGIFNDDLESPTSVLNFVDSTLSAHQAAIGLNQQTQGGLIACEGNNNFGWKSVEMKPPTNTMGMMNEGTTSYGAGNTSTYLGGESEVEAISSVMDGLSEIFGYDTATTIMEGGNSNAVVNSGNNVSCSGEFEENKTYWNSMLNLVDTTTATGSPVF